MSGIFLLACGASALNQVQERKEDAKMDRTKNRPLPSGKISVKIATLVALLLLFSGTFILSCGYYWISVVLGILNILWYNGFYTGLKKRTAFAVIPGALSGAIPVFMGWTAGGGNISDSKAILLAFFLFMWQIPHFWLLMMKYEGEYRNAGFPVMTDIFNLDQFRNIIVAWMIGASGTSLLLGLSGFFPDFLSAYIIMVFNILILVFFFEEFYFRKKMKYRLMAIAMNLFLLVVLAMIVAEKFNV